MAARKSTASNPRHNSKQTPPGQRQISGRKPKAVPERITSAEPYGVLVGDRLATVAEDIDAALKAMQAIEGGYLVRLFLNDSASREAERPAERRRMRRQTNPLARQLAEQHGYVLYAINEELGDHAALLEPFGQTMRASDDRRKGDDPMRRATDEEAALATLETAKHFKVDVRGDLAAQVIENLSGFIRELQATVRRLKTAKRNGIFDPPAGDQTGENTVPKAARRGKAVPA